MNASAKLTLSKGMIPEASGLTIFLAADEHCYLRGMQDGILCFEQQLPWDEATWNHIDVKGYGPTTFYADVTPWCAATSVELPPNARGEWFWISYCGLRGDAWYDGPLGCFDGDHAVSYTPPLGTGSLSLAAKAASTPRAWQEVKATTLPAIHHLHSAGLFLAAKWRNPPNVFAEDLCAVSAVSLITLARAFPSQRLQVELATVTPPARKFLLHIGAHLKAPGLRPKSEATIDVEELTDLLSPFATGLAAEVSRLSPIIPEQLGMKPSSKR